MTSDLLHAASAWTHVMQIHFSALMQEEKGERLQHNCSDVITVILKVFHGIIPLAGSDQSNASVCWTVVKQHACCCVSAKPNSQNRIILASYEDRKNYDLALMSYPKK